MATNFIGKARPKTSDRVSELVEENIRLADAIRRAKLEKLDALSRLGLIPGEWNPSTLRVIATLSAAHVGFLVGALAPMGYVYGSLATSVSAFLVVNEPSRNFFRNLPNYILYSIAIAGLFTFHVGFAYVLFNR